MSVDSLIIRHRPTKLNQIIGQDEVVLSFQSALKNRTSHGFLFTGPSGVGKTTMAYIGARMVGAKQNDIIERDAASYSGKDDMRALVEVLRYRPLGKVKVVLLEEVHRLSPAAWDAALKMLEQPPDWVYWFLTTTDASKVPDAIATRCIRYALKPVRVSLLLEFLDTIVEVEKFDTPRQIIELCAKTAEGSPRRALSNLAACYAAEDRAEAARLIADFELKEAGTPYALARAIADGWRWDKIQPLLKSLSEEGANAESIRQTVRAYVTTCLLDMKDEGSFCKGLKILDEFSTSFNAADGISPVILAVGRVLYGNK